MVLVDVDIAQEADDMFIEASGTAPQFQYILTGHSTAPTIRTVRNGTPTSSFAGTRVFYLFKGITIPMGSTIDDATFTIQGVENLTATTIPSVSIGAVNNSQPQFITTSNNTFTASQGQWNTPLIGNVTFTIASSSFTGGPEPMVTDVKTMVQDLVNAFDYVDDSMMFRIGMVPFTVNQAGTKNGVNVTIFDIGATSSANLIINYTEAGCNSDLCDDFNEYAVSKLPTFREKFNFSTQALADASWVSSDTALIRVDPATERLNFNWTNHFLSDTIYHDLGSTVSQTDWTLRCKATFPDVGEVTINAFCIGLYDSNAQDSGVVQDGVTIFMSNVVALRVYDNETLLGGTISPAQTQPTANVPVFWELKRIGGDTFRFTQYSDSNYSVIIDSEEVTGIAPTVDGLRFIKCLNRNDFPTASESIGGFFEDIEFWNDGQQGDKTFPTDFTQKEETFFDNMFSGVNFTIITNAPGGDFNFGGSVLDTKDDTDGLNHSAIHALPDPLSNTKWVMRVRVSPRILTLATTNEAVLHIGAFDSDETVNSATAQDFLGFTLRVGIGGSSWDLKDTDGVAPNVTAPDTSSIDTPIAFTDRFIEISRTSATTYQAKLFTDVDYTDLIDTITGACSATTDGLSFIGVKANTNVDATAVAEAFIVEMALWNGTGEISNWTQVSPSSKIALNNFRVNPDGGIATFEPSEIIWDVNDVSTNNAISHDLQSSIGFNADDDNWTLRAKVIVNNVVAGTSADTNRLYLGLFDSDQSVDSNTAQDGLFIGFARGITANEIGLYHRDGVILDANSDVAFTTTITPTTFFVEIKRTSATSVAISLFSESTYTTLIETQTATIPAGITSLRFIKAQNRSTLTGDSTLDGTIDDLEFYNGVSVPKTPIFETKDHEDLFIADNFTNMNGTKVTVNTTTQVIDWSSSVNAVYNEGEFNDIIGKTINTDRWALRCKLVINTATAGGDTTANDLFIGFSDDGTSLPQVGQDFIGWRWGLNNPDGVIRTITSDGLALNSSPGGAGIIFLTPITTGTFYLETIRNGSNIVGTIYSDPDFTQVIESVTEPIEVGITGLRFLKVMVSNVDGSANSTFDGTIDNIQFWDGQVAKNHENKWRKTDP